MTDGVRVVTVSATYGAGGSIIGPKLADELGLPFADRLLRPDHGAASTAERVTEEELDEEPAPPVLKSLSLLSSTWGFSGPQDAEDVPARVRNDVERSLAALLRSGAVILGRAAAVAIGPTPGAFHIRLDGPPERRARRGATWEGIDLVTARARLERTDAARTRYVERLYGRHPADPSLYHLLIDTTVLALDSCVDLAAAAARASWSYDDRADQGVRK